MYHLQVFTPEKIAVDEEVLSLIAPGKEGYFGVLTNHAPLISLLKAGVLIITRKDNKKSFFNVSKGFLEVSHNQATILIKTIEPRNPIDIGTGGGI